MATHKYEDVRLEDGDHDSRSSTEVESLMGEEKSPKWQGRAQQQEPLPRERSKTSNLKRILRSSRWMLDTTLLFIIIALLVRNEGRKEAHTPTPTSMVEQVQLMGDMTGVGPRCAFLGLVPV